MQVIDLTQWERREHFEFFRTVDIPFYNTNFELEITGLRETLKANGISLNHAIVHGTIATLSAIENFRYRLIDEQVVLFDELHPSFTCMRPNERLFRTLAVPFVPDLATFDVDAKQRLKRSQSYFDRSDLSQQPNLVYMSPLPWIPFTGIDHAMTLDNSDTIPRISWGRFFERGHQTYLPYNIQVNHLFIDGLHVGEFYQGLQTRLKALTGG